MAPRKHITCGWCQTGHHERCPGVMRHHRHTPSGKELREIICACGCATSATAA